ncbi:hypothetical protein AWB69_04925 [Caballeronia udeis]|uniref:Lipoprotein n=1 Tax=Caballeronia udeis TaxID=1232866 RepID=A0A158HXW9_9BURK|nr:hypothetical protein [Caballeronia udeis]SAL48819.1 hypothetical protein AWB69_04925 [Caballeronia udeis]
MKPQLLVCALALAAGVLSLTPFVTVHADPIPHETGGSRSKTTDQKRHPRDLPFEFRGIPLGITLDEFQAGATVRATPVDSVPVCETDVIAGSLGMSLKTRESLTVACRWAHQRANGWALSQAVVDGTPAQDHMLRFARVNGQTEFRLYEMSFVIDEGTASDLRHALADRYGAPRAVAHASASTSAGNALPVYEWENAVSSITLRFLPATRNATLVYLLKAPDAWVKSVVQQWKTSSVDAS